MGEEYENMVEERGGIVKTSEITGPESDSETERGRRKGQLTWCGLRYSSSILDGGTKPCGAAGSARACLAAWWSSMPACSGVRFDGGARVGVGHGWPVSGMA